MTGKNRGQHDAFCMFFMLYAVFCMQLRGYFGSKLVTVVGVPKSGSSLKDCPRRFMKRSFMKEKGGGVFLWL